jgi:hypothetical protein
MNQPSSQTQHPSTFDKLKDIDARLTATFAEDSDDPEDEDYHPDEEDNPDDLMDEDDDDELQIDEDLQDEDLLQRSIPEYKKGLFEALLEDEYQDQSDEEEPDLQTNSNEQIQKAKINYLGLHPEREIIKTKYLLLTGISKTSKDQKIILRTIANLATWANLKIDEERIIRDLRSDEWQIFENLDQPTCSMIIPLLDPIECAVAAIPPQFPIYLRPSTTKQAMLNKKIIEVNLEGKFTIQALPPKAKSFREFGKLRILTIEYFDF